MSDPIEILRSRFKYDNFREPQNEIINSILEKNDTLAILPTGGGKSLCYQIPAIIMDGVTIVISPLISLMKDQVEQLKGKVNSEFLNSFLTYQEQQKIQNALLRGEINILYVSPEKFISNGFNELLKKIKIPLFAIDEAHCVSEWGHDFRPSYLKIIEVVRNFPDSVLAAFTASATPEVKEDIVVKLGLRNPRIYVKGFERKNLILTVIKTKNRNKKLVSILKDLEGSTIVYCQSRKEVETVNDLLTKKGISSLPYHAGLPIGSRKTTQEFFQHNKIRIIVATNAFGMGINKEDIRAVIHYNMPGTVENYYQEIGRAGRDGKNSEVILLYQDSNDKRIHEYFIQTAKVDRELVNLFYNKLNNIKNIKLNEINNFKYSIDLADIKNQLNEDITASQLNIILRLFEKHELIKIYYSDDNFLRIKLNIEINDINNSKYTFEENEVSLLNLIVRKHGNAAGKVWIKLNVSELCNQLLLEKKELHSIINLLLKKEVLTLLQNSGKETVTFIKPRMYAEQLPFDYSELQSRYLNSINKLTEITNYIYSKDCRWKYILKYFGEITNENYRCNICDNCQKALSQKIETNLDFNKEILKTIKQINGEFGINLVCEILVGSKSKKILQNRLNKVSTYGFCSRISKELLKEKINQLIIEDKISKTEDHYPRLELTEAGENLISDLNLTKLELTEVVSEEPTVLIDLRENLSLYERLVKVRKYLSKKFSQPYYMICSDDVLREMTLNPSKTILELSKIKGVTERFINKCGSYFVNDMKEYLKEQNISTAEKKIFSLPESIRLTYNMIKDGMSLIEICEKRNLTDAIISDHIATLLENNFTIKLESLISKENIQLIRETLSEIKTRSIIVLKQKLPEHVSYSEIRICLCYWDNRNK